MSLEISIKQAAARALRIHATVLARLDDNPDLPPFDVFGARTPAQIRGCQKVWATLCRWGAVKDGRITDQGRAILTRFREINPRFHL
jgi:hypothetical protein